MPLIGFAVNGKNYSFKEALKDPLGITGLPTMMLIGIIKNSQYRGKSISATTLTGCRRKTYYERTYDYYMDPKGLIFKAFRGSVIHQILETVANGGGAYTGMYGIDIDLAIDAILKEYITEKRFARVVKINGKDVEVSGKIDVYHKSTFTIEDYKTTEPYPVLKINEKGLDVDHVFQLNFYKWITAPYLRVDNIILHYIGYGFVGITGRKTTVKQFAKNVTVDIPNVPVWDEDEFLYHALPRIEEMHNAFKNGVVPSKDPGENNFRCKSCAFGDRCSKNI
jgi:hypothetical protein